jgi:6-phospho-beta-glucosidase
VKLALLGGGGFRTPLVYRALLGAAGRLGVDEVVLHDVEARRLDRIGAVLAGLAGERGARLPFRGTTDLDDALEGAGVVFCAIRVGGMAGRVVDEEVPLAHDVLGQETVGPGGIAFALRTVPVMTRIAETLARRSPDAWLINFTNPAGLVTEAVAGVLGDRVVGICDSPEGLCHDVARALGRPAHDLAYDYFGLNHLGWLRAARDASGEDLLPALLADRERLAGMHLAGLFDADWLQSVGMLPNDYLHYYYDTREAVSAIRASDCTRAQYLDTTQRAFYGAIDEPPDEALRSWRRAANARNATYMADVREGDDPAAAEPDDDADPVGGYEHVALAAVAALVGDEPRTLILNTANRGAMPYLDARAVVEVPCRVSRAGVEPLPAGDAPLHARGLVEAVKDVERTTIEAARSGSRRLAVRAVAMHPVVPSVGVARRIVSAYVAREPTLAALLS